MKMLFCENCWDVFKLDYDLRQCKCGLVKGKYDKDGHGAVSNGKGRSMALNNNLVMHAIGRMEAFQENDADNYDRYYDDARIPFWVRPNDGPGNPRSRVEEDLK